MSVRGPLTLLVFAVLTISSAWADTARPGEPFDREAALRDSQAAVGRTVGDYVFRDTTGQPVALADFRGGPVIVNLVYTACSHYCPVTIQSLARGVAAAQESLGADSVTVLTVGFDSRNDTPPRMAAFARAQDIDLPNWHFLSADDETLLALTAELGFVYHPAPHGFDHLAQTTLLDAQSRIYRQVYGTDFGVPAIVEPLKAMQLGRTDGAFDLGTLVERVRLFCTLYDPAVDAYRFDWSFFTGLAIGAACLLALAGFLGHAVVQWRRAQRSRLTAAGPPNSSGNVS